MEIKGIIFDLDGTLLDSMFIWDTIGADYLIKRGITPEDGLNEKFKVMSIHQGAQYFIDTYHLSESVQEIVDDVHQMIEHYYFHEITLKKRVLPLLEKFQSQGIHMCIATATDRYMVEAALLRNQIADYFSEIFTCSEVGSGKDSPKIYELALASLATSKENTYIFEDALYAIETAKNAGFKVVSLYDHSYRDDQLRIQEIADIYLNSLEEWQHND